MQLVANEEWAQRCAADGEFALAARHWDGGLRLQVGESTLELALNGGVVAPGPATDQSKVIEFSGPQATWSKVFAAKPERFHNDVMANITVGGGLSRAGDAVTHAQYFAAAMRAVELLRPPFEGQSVLPREQRKRTGFDTPVGRYVHLDLGGHDHRVYFEEAGQGIPILMQHTAGCHGSQWRHLMEEADLTDRFRLIAYDLPYHGKSLPPVDRDWWSERYDLKGDFLRSVPLQLAEALQLDRPVFMGCSVGGLLALDLAHRHPEAFRAVISVEGALRIGGDLSHLEELYHPQVNNEYKARLMDGLMAPESPLPYRKETSFVYASGWPPAFRGDLAYYIDEYDLRGQAGEIDTNRVGVHILSGEYDYSGTAELGKEAHEAIPGSTWVEMKGVGHFPMSENPEAFLSYLRPILDQIA